MERLVESYFLTMGDVKKIDEKTLPDNLQIKLKESNNAGKFKYIAAYRVPVSRYNFKNANGRIYPKELWENVIKNQRDIWEGCVGLADHPSENEEGSVKNIFCVWNDLRLNEQNNTVEATAYFVGPYGRLAQEVLEAGGKIGLSSSGFGEFKEDNSTVDPSSYKIERISDWVLSPSQGVFGTMEMKIGEMIKKADKELHENENVQENTVNREVTKKSMKLSKLEERKLRKDIDLFYTEAMRIEDPLKRKEELLEVLSYFNDFPADDLKEKVEKSLQETEEEIKKIIQNHQKIEKELGISDADKLKEIVTEKELSLKIQEQKSIDYKKISENLQKTIQNLKAEISSRPTVEMYEDAVAHSKVLEKKLKRMQQSIEVLKKQYKKKFDMYQKKFEETSKEVSEEMEKVTLSNKKMKEKLVELRDKLQEYMNKYNFYFKEYTNLVKNIKKIQDKDKKLEYTPKKTVEENYSVYNESSKVREYFEDLIKRHGDAIMEYEDRFLACKTLFEASKLYVSILPELESTVVGSTIGDPVLRKKLVEATTGRKIVRGPVLRIPEGWE